MVRVGWLCVGLVACGGGAASEAYLSPCGGPPARDATCEIQDALVVTSDGTSTAVGGVRADGSSFVPLSTEVGRSPSLSISGGRYFVVDRDGGMLFEADNRCGLPRLRASASSSNVRNASDPQDVVVLKGGTYAVSRANDGNVAFFRACGVAPDVVSFMPFDEAGAPQPGAMGLVTVGTTETLFAVLKRGAVGTTPARTTRLARVNPTSLTVDKVTDLHGTNPVGRLVNVEGAWLVAQAGNADDPGESNAGIEKVDIETGATQWLNREVELGGSMVAFDVDGRCGVAIVSGGTNASGRTSLVTFDTATGAVYRNAAAPVFGPTPGNDLLALAFVGKRLFVTDGRRQTAGYPVHIFDEGANCTFTPRGPTPYLNAPAVAIGALASREAPSR